MRARNRCPPAIHRLAASPLGIVFEARLFDRWRLEVLGVEFAIRRAAAAASVTVGGSIDDFLNELGPSVDVPRKMRQRIGAALFQFALAWRRCQESRRQWDEAFWDGKPASPEELIALEAERRRLTDPCVTGRRIFGFLGRTGIAPTAKYDITPPAVALREWADRLVDPAPLYRPPSVVPKIETSAKMPGPAGVEYVVRFKSPSPFTNDTCFARVYEPRRVRDPLPTFIFGDGMSMQYDQEVYWPAEEFLGRRLAARGWRVILFESPWHGRRTPPGSYSCEPYLATLPVGAIRLFSAQVQEIALLTGWARSLGAERVVVGGMSLGGIVAHHVAGRCGDWPEAMRPDSVALIAFSSPMHKLMEESRLGRVLGVSRELQRAGWTEGELSRLSPILDPPDVPGIPPDRIFAFLGRGDDVAPYRFAMESLRKWRVPSGNITTHNAGHITIAVKWIRTPGFLDAALHPLAVE